MAGDARRPLPARGAVCVIDAGTAITLDLLTADGAHWAVIFCRVLT